MPTANRGNLVLVGPANNKRGRGWVIYRIRVGVAPTKCYRCLDYEHTLQLAGELIEAEHAAGADK